MVVCGGGLNWALPELGDDVYERYSGIRRPGSNRLMGGGWMQQVVRKLRLAAAVSIMLGRRLMLD